MTAVIFTWPPDYVAAALAARALIKLGVRVVLAIDPKHPLPFVEGCEVIQTSFSRGGNLNGKECVLGILRLLAEQAGSDEWVLKVDSDALVRGLGWLEGWSAEAVGLYHPAAGPGQRGFFGFCYALRTSALPALIERACALPDDPWLPEDETIGSLAQPVHRFENLAPGCPMAAYNWDGKRPIEEWKQRYQVMVFQRVPGHGRRAVLNKMKEFA